MAAIAEISKRYPLLDAIYQPGACRDLCRKQNGFLLPLLGHGESGCRPGAVEDLVGRAAHPDLVGISSRIAATMRCEKIVFALCGNCQEDSTESLLSDERVVG